MISSYFFELLTVGGIHLLAVMSPGPDFAMVSRNSLVHSRRTGIYCALGLALGILVHVSYSLIGIGLVIARSVAVFSILKFLGAAYLIYIGIASWRSKGGAGEAADRKNRELSRGGAIRMGFLTNVSNPKVTLFFLSLFTQVINPKTPLTIQLLYGLEMSGMTFAWFTLVATALSHQAVKNRFAAAQHRVEKVFGAVLIALGVKIAVSDQR